MARAGRHVWIVGASAGIGAALARELAGRGHKVALSARDEDKLKELAAGLAGDGHLVAALDVAANDGVVAARDEIMRQWQRIDSVIYMAGLYQPMRLGGLDLAETKRIVDVNLTGAFNVTEAALPALLKAPAGQLALCASVAGYRGLPRSQPYGATKAALINLAQSLQAEHGAELDIKVINPGFVASRLTAKNDFPMPFRISAEAAARAIAAGLEGGAFEIHFPKRFTCLMKVLSVLPAFVYLRIMRRP